MGFEENFYNYSVIDSSWSVVVSAAAALNLLSRRGQWMAFHSDFNRGYGQIMKLKVLPYFNSFINSFRF